MAFRILTSGESHRESLTAVIDGVPSGFALAQGHPDGDLARRQHGLGRGMLIETEVGRVSIELLESPLGSLGAW